MDSGESETRSYNELLGINKPEEWLSEQWLVCSEVVKQDEEIFSNLLTQFLMNTGELPFIVASKLNRMEEGLSKLTTLFYTIGYMKGKLSKESTGNLDSLWKED